MPEIIEDIHSVTAFRRNPVLAAIPLAKDAHGVYRVSGTRVTLDLVVHAFNQGATAGEIVRKFPSLALPDVDRIIG